MKRRTTSEDSTSLRKWAQELLPLSSFPEDAISELLEQAKLWDVSPGKILCRQHQKDKNVIYLLQGRLKLERDGVVYRHIQAQTDIARLPICAAQPRTATVITESSSLILTLDTDLFDIQTGDQYGYDVTEISAEDAASENQLLANVLLSYHEQTLKLPTLPETALTIRRLMQREDPDLQTIIRLVRLDPALTSRLVGVANSSSFRGVQPVRSCHEAITRLGAKHSLSLILALSIKEVFTSTNRQLLKRIQRLWHHSSHVAAIAYLLSKYTRLLDPNHAMLAGLLHSIGDLTILMQADQFPELLREPDLLEQTLCHLRGDIGALVLRTWSFDQKLIDVAIESRNYFRDPSEHIDYVDLALVAYLYSYLGASDKPALPPLCKIPAFGKLIKGRLSSSQSIDVLAIAKNELTQLQQQLAI
ncbi:MAG TPA: HDOD domain-containing protein [Gammaproteobacteria bacterium]|nr:HDOD domain-containing protein [Gammaproteobacteria bacterium]